MFEQFCENLNNIWMPNYSTELESLELKMGPVADKENHFSFYQIAERDELEEFPTAACEILNEWGLGQFYVPKECGGKLKSFETLFGLLRLISRRDLTISIGHGKTYLGASPIWVAGSPEQKEKIAKLILNHGVISLGLTEKEHGSDLVANEVFAIHKSSHYSISGEKWLINNATRGDTITLFARTSEKTPSRSYSIFIVHKKNNDKNSYYHLPKIKTHGIRGADISGIGFIKTQVNESNLISKEGSGLEVILKSLQISRTICANLSLGAADTALRSTLKFATNRKLYGLTIPEIPYVKETLIDSFFDILICESVSIFATRCLHFCPELMSIYSSVVKYLVPKKVESLFDSLAGILGARFYLRESHDHGIFQKFVRDNSLVGLFDGSSIVNLQTISNQINSIAKKSKETLNKGEFIEKYRKIFSLNISVDDFTPKKLCLTTQGMDFIPYSFELILDNIEEDVHNNKKEIISLLNTLIKERDCLFNSIEKKNYTVERIDKEKEIHIIKYCLIVAAGCCAGILHYNSYLSNNFISSDILLKLCLTKLTSEICHENFSFQTSDMEHVWKYMTKLFSENRLFSLIPMQLK